MIAIIDTESLSLIHRASTRCMLVIDARVYIQSITVFTVFRGNKERGRFHVFRINEIYHNSLPLMNVLQSLHGVAFGETERTSVQVIDKLKELI